MPLGLRRQARQRLHPGPQRRLLLPPGIRPIQLEEHEELRKPLRKQQGEDSLAVGVS